MKNLQPNVNLSFQQLIEVVKQLSPLEKLELNEVLWSDSNEIPLENQKLVLSRMQKSKVNPKRMLDWDAASKTLLP